MPANLDNLATQAPRVLPRFWERVPAAVPAFFSTPGSLERRARVSAGLGLS